MDWNDPEVIALNKRHEDSDLALQRNLYETRLMVEQLEEENMRLRRMYLARINARHVAIPDAVQEHLKLRTLAQWEEAQAKLTEAEVDAIDFDVMDAEILLITVNEYESLKEDAHYCACLMKTVEERLKHVRALYID